MKWDVFISHATEDKEEVAIPIADALSARGLRVWFDTTELSVGDSLRRKIDEGLSQSRYGIVILTHNFFAKHWPQVELDGLVSRETGSDKVVLPVWHKLTLSDVQRYSPILASRVGLSFEQGIERTIDAILRVVAPKASADWPALGTTPSGFSLLDIDWHTGRFYPEARAASVFARNAEFTSAFEVARHVLRLNARPGLIRVVRERQFIGLSQSYDVLLDYDDVASVYNGDSVGFFVPAGKHRVSTSHYPSEEYGMRGFKNNPSHSNVLVGDVSPDSILVARCHVGFIGFRLILDPMSSGWTKEKREWNWAW